MKPRIGTDLAPQRIRDLPAGLVRASARMLAGPLGLNAAALANYDEAMAKRARTWQAIVVGAAIGAFLGTYRIKDPTAQAFLIGTSVGCLVRAASTPLLMATSSSLRRGGA